MRNLNTLALAGLLMALPGASPAPAQTAAVAHLTVLSGNGQAVCQCNHVPLEQFQNISVKATDSGGNAVVGATVNWSVIDGQMNLGNASATNAIGDRTGTSVTDSNGVASHFIGLIVINPYYSATTPYLVSHVQATVNNVSVTFVETESLIVDNGSPVIAANGATYNGGDLGALTGNAGGTLSTPIRVQVAGLGQAGGGVPNISVRLTNAQNSPTISCASNIDGADPGAVLSDSRGYANCYPTMKGSGPGTFYINIGGPAGGSDPTTALYLNMFGPFSFTSAPGAPKTFTVISGNNQIGTLAQQLNPMVAQLTDVNGNVVYGQNVVWTVTPPGAVALVATTTVTDLNGEVSSAPVLYGPASAGAQITVAVQGNTSVSATFLASLANAITALNKIGGDNQTAQINTAFSRQVQVQLLNANGPVKNYPVQFTTTGPISVLETSPVATDANGYAYLDVKAGATAGAATVKLVVGTFAQTFNLTVTTQPAAPPPNGIVITSGNGQGATINAPFPSPLIVQVNSTAGPVAGYTVSFSSTGPIILPSGSVLTDSNGLATMTATAGSVSGAATVTASVTGGYSVTFNLTVNPQGPQITGASFLNAASRVAGAISPCSLAILSAPGLTPDGIADLSPAAVFGKLPTSVHNLSITLGGTLAPIVNVAMGAANPEVTFQVPCEVTPGTAVPAVVNVGGGITKLNIAVQAVSPGIFETVNSDGNKRAVVMRDDGSFADYGSVPSNPARHGEYVRIYATGLGATIPAVGTNSIQNPNADLFGLDALVAGQVQVALGGYGGVRVISSRQAPDLIGVYEVQVQLPSDAPSGADVVVSLGIIPANSPSGTQAVQSQASKITILQ